MCVLIWFYLNIKIIHTSTMPMMLLEIFQHFKMNHFRVDALAIQLEISFKFVIIMYD
mgnify:CR=1 FL=1